MGNKKETITEGRTRVFSSVFEKRKERVMNSSTQLSRQSRLLGSTASGPSLARRGRASSTRRNVVVRASNNTFPRDWLKKDLFPLYAGFLGWTIPSSIPVGSYGGDSLFYKLNESIAIQFAKFPVGPQTDDPFWIYLITWHLGLFITLTLAKIGYEGRKEGYFGPIDESK